MVAVTMQKYPPVLSSKDLACMKLLKNWVKADSHNYPSLVSITFGLAKK